MEYINNPKVSIIIPVYNTQDYVKEAVESILNQTLRNIEVIIINDGSTDGSLDIIRELASKDKRIYILDQKNQGQSVARDNGINQASGEYLYFMDSDDLLEPDALESCFNICQNNNLDFVFFDASVLQNNNIKKMNIVYTRGDYTKEDIIYNGCDILNILLENHVFSASPCLSFIKTSFLKESNNSFYPGIIHEDELFTSKLYLQAESVMAIHKAFFIRRFRADSTMTRTFAWKNINGYLTVSYELIKFKEQSSEKIKKTIDLYLSQMLNAAVWKAYTLKSHERFRLFIICMLKYKKYVSTKTLMTLLFKSYLSKE